MGNSHDSPRLSLCREADQNQREDKTYPAWKWTDEMYVVESDRRLGDISIAEIDPTMRLADVERKNNRLKLQ